MASNTKGLHVTVGPKGESPLDLGQSKILAEWNENTHSSQKKSVIYISHTDACMDVLKRNKYVGILSIAVTTLQYITISMITIFSMYIAHVCSGSGCNSYQGHVNDSGEFWRVLGCTRIRHH